MLKEFKKFILRGNVLDLAVGIIIGGAFTNIVNSLVNNIIMPIMGVLTFGVDFKSLSIDLSKIVEFIYNKEVEVILPIGLFLNQIVEFLIIGFALFMLIKFLNRFAEKKEEVVEEKPVKEEIPEDIKLLREIRNLLKK